MSSAGTTPPRSENCPFRVCFRWSSHVPPAARHRPQRLRLTVLCKWSSAMLMFLMRGWHAPSPARASSLQASSSGNVGGSGAACHILAHGDATTWLCDDEAGSCAETQHMVLCTEPNDTMHCVLQESLFIDGKPVWACAPVNLEGRESSRDPAPQRSSSQLHMSLVRRRDA
jgi:hypothetical protein